MLTEYRDSYTVKFSSPFTAFLHSVYMDNGNLPSYGNACDGPGSVVHVGGRHVLVFHTSGFVGSDKLPTRTSDFDEWVREEYPGMYAWDVWTHDPARDGAGCGWCGAYAQVDANNLCEECFQNA